MENGRGDNKLLETRKKVDKQKMTQQIKVRFEAGSVYSTTLSRVQEMVTPDNIGKGKEQAGPK